ncbi:MAG TPA: Rid family hydrolase, partial [Allosphingosinicella sp.]
DRTYARIGAILARAGAGWDDVVDITSYHTDIAAQFPAMVSVHRRYVRAPFPAWTAIDVDRLIPDRGITELKIVARRPERPRNPRARR